MTEAELLNRHDAIKLLILSQNIEMFLRNIAPYQDLEISTGDSVKGVIDKVRDLGEAAKMEYFRRNS
jgi:hypothetical protein